MPAVLLGESFVSSESVFLVIRRLHLILCKVGILQPHNGKDLRFDKSIFYTYLPNSLCLALTLASKRWLWARDVAF